MFTIQCHHMAIGACTALAVLSAPAAWTREAWMVVTHEVEDFDRWRAVFDHALPTRRAVGEIASYILHNPTDPNVVTVWFEWDTMERAQSWAADPVLANGMTAAGVISTPVFSFHAIEATSDKRHVALDRR